VILLLICAWFSRTQGKQHVLEPFVAICRPMIDMKLTNDSYVILIHTRTATERYYRDRSGWLKVSTRGREFRATAEQVLNHLLPALAGLKPNLIVEVEYHPRSA
jgi:hypothetical protein